jgi:hypothetical protein
MLRSLRLLFGPACRYRNNHILALIAKARRKDYHVSPVARLESIAIVIRCRSSVAYGTDSCLIVARGCRRRWRCFDHYCNTSPNSDAFGAHGLRR